MPSPSLKVPKAFRIFTTIFSSSKSFLPQVSPRVLEHSSPVEFGPSYMLFISSVRNVRPKMTIYVCQEVEQNRAPLQQKRDGSGDSNLCGELGTTAGTLQPGFQAPAPAQPLCVW